jgi:hypothetical protein
MADDHAPIAQVPTSGAHSATDDVKVEPDFASGSGLSRGERTIVRRLSGVLRFNDFMTFMMVIATGFSAFSTWRTAQVTNLLFTVAERPYIGVQEVTVDGIDAGFARVVVDCRNFGQVQAVGGVARIVVTVDGKPLPRATAVADTENIGIVSPSVPHRIFRFVPSTLYEAVRDGQSRMIVHVEFAYRGPDQRRFCYSKLFIYDSRTDNFIPSGGSDQCGGEVY